MKPFVLKGHERPVNIIRFNYDGDLFFSGSAQSKINLWEAYTGQRIGSYQTKSAVKSLDVDINTNYVVCCGFDGTLEIFKASTGQSLRWVRFALKLKHLQFNLNSTRLLVICDQLKINTPSLIKIFNFESLLKAPINQNRQMNQKDIKPQLQFQTLLQQTDPKPIQNANRALWYIDNKSFFVCTDQGYIARYDQNGKLVKRAIIHQKTKINGLAFSKDFSILGTAADNGSKIIDPETFQIIRYFKQELPMNSISISPLFCSVTNPKYHMIMGGGVKAILAAMTGGQSGFQAHVCNIMHGTQVGRIGGHFGPINSIQFFKDGRGYVSGAEEGTIRVVRFQDAYFQENNLQYQ